MECFLNRAQVLKKESCLFSLHQSCDWAKKAAYYIGANC